jgi:hypothetical protein
MSIVANLGVLSQCYLAHLGGRKLSATYLKIEAIILGIFMRFIGSQSRATSVDGPRLIIVSPSVKTFFENIISGLLHPVMRPFFQWLTD